MSEEWRKIKSNPTEVQRKYSDNGIQSIIDGIRWFRFVPPAGNKLSNKDIGGSACDTNGSGWINGSDPTVVGQVVSREVCVSLGSKPCWQSPGAIKIGRCQDNRNEFLVYQLKTLQCSPCAYCVK